MKLDKLEVARRQLGVALHLFVENADPVSIYTLTAAGMELAQGLAESAGYESFMRTAIAADPRLTEQVYHQARTQAWNAFKHFSLRGGKPRDDTEIFAAHNDEANELGLFIGWYDLMRVANGMPIEVQMFHIWFFSRHRHMLDPKIDEACDLYFPDILKTPRSQHKDLLRKAIRKAFRMSHIKDDARTENRRLVLPNNLAEYEH